jgi:hypothetical protein
MREIGQRGRLRARIYRGWTKGDSIEEAAMKFLEVSNKIHITGLVAICSVVNHRQL